MTEPSSSVDSSFVLVVGTDQFQGFPLHWPPTVSSDATFHPVSRPRLRLSTLMCPVAYACTAGISSTRVCNVQPSWSESIWELQDVCPVTVCFLTLRSYVSKLCRACSPVNDNNATSPGALPMQRLSLLTFVGRPLPLHVAPQHLARLGR
jgi:hypothetical protein